MNISCFKREKTSKYTEKQANKAKKLCKKLANLLYRSKCCVVLDDEKYFTHDGSNMEGNDRYYTNDKSKCQDNLRFHWKREISSQSNGLGGHMQMWHIQATNSSIKV